ncbi:MAG: hypothetical protein D3903_10110 [Candidatus Electrothrix sp. GM3_4]|nr:hypothetical protein [Candidatus Electrothrix sp. GM3_4]
MPYLLIKKTLYLSLTLPGERILPFKPGGKYLLIFNLGNGTGILKKWSIVLNGRLSFLVKDWIDRRFMRIFQGFE